MWQKFLSSCITFLVLTGLAFASTPSTELVGQGRALLFQNGNPTYQGVLDANERFMAAVGQDPSDPEANLFYALTRLASFALKTSGGGSLQTLADVIQAMGIPLFLDRPLAGNPPFGSLPQLAGQPNLPWTMPNGDDFSKVIGTDLVVVIDLALENLSKATPSIQVILTPEETGETTEIEIDYTDVLLARAVLNGVKTVALIIGAYDLDQADVRELVALGNAGMMELHPHMITQLLARYPNFLTLPAGGVTKLSQAKAALISCRTLLSDAFASLNQEINSGLDDQDDELFTFESEGDLQSFENLLAGLGELVTSLNQNRPATLQDKKIVWNLTLTGLGSLAMEQTGTWLGNGTVIRDESNFWGTLNGVNINGRVSYWKVTGTSIKIILEWWGYQRLELDGTLASGGTTITDGAWSRQTYDGSDYTQNQTGTFTAARSSQESDDLNQFDLNALFGSATKSALNIRNFLPQFDLFGEPKPGTFPEPVFNGLFPDVTTNAQVNEALELEDPYKLFTLPTAAITLDGLSSDWPAQALVNTDPDNDFYPGWSEGQGMNITATYLARDASHLYMAMDLADNPIQQLGVSSQVNYNFELRQNRFDWHQNVYQVSAHYAQGSSQWQVDIGMRDASGMYQHLTTLDNNFISAGTSFIEWKIPLSIIGPLDTYGGKWISSHTWSSWIHDGDSVGDNAQLAPVFTVQGTVSVPGSPAGGNIYVYLSENPYPTFGDNALIGSYEENVGAFSLANAPYAQNLYVHAFWDADGNGIPNSGDYTGIKPVSVQGNVNVGDIELNEIPPPFSLLAVTVKNVHSGNNQLKTFFEVVFEQGFSGNLPHDIASITIIRPDGTSLQAWPHGGAVWESSWNGFFLELPGSPQLGEYKFIVTAKDGSTEIKSDFQKKLITLPIVDVTKVRIDTSSKTPIISWEPVQVPGIKMAYRLEVNGVDEPFSFRTSRDYNLTRCAVPGLQPGKQYQYRIRAMDHSDWIIKDNRSHTDWIPFTMDNSLGHAAIPAVDLDYWGAVEWSHVGSNPGIDLWVKVIDHDGVSYNGSSHSVYARPIDASGNLIGDFKKHLNLDHSENAIAGYYYGWIDSQYIPPNTAGVRFFAIDPDGIETTIDDIITGADMVPPQDIGLTCVVDGTTPIFTWNPVAGAKHYRIRIYDENGKTTIARLSVPNVTTFTIPPGYLNPETTYQYRLEARNANWGFDTDQNIAFPPRDSSNNYPKFTTGTRTDKPFIDANSYGVSTWSDAYSGTTTDFWMRVYDAQGVPNNIQSVKAIHPNGLITELHYEYSESDICAIYSNSSYEDETPQEGVYRVEVTDKERNTFFLTETLDVNPMGYPDLSALKVVVNGTGSQFDWAGVKAEDGTAPAFYRLGIYNKDHERIFEFVTIESEYSLAPGFLKKGEVYSFRVSAMDHFWNQNPDNPDNGSASPWNYYRALNFKTQPAVNTGSSLPVIDTDNIGVVVTYLEHPVTGLASYWLQFSVKVTDEDGVPGNIKSVTVTGPGITNPFNLNYDSPEGANRAEYWNDIIFNSYEDIPEGEYTFRVEDEGGNVAMVTDTLVKKKIPLVPYLTPANGAVVSSDRTLIDWHDPVGGPYFYQIRIYQHWNKHIHSSGILNTSSYIIPAGILKKGELYGYRIYASDKDLGTEDVDNLSVNQMFFAKQNHFIASDAPPVFTLQEVIKLMEVLIGKRGDIPSAGIDTYDMNQDRQLDMRDLLPVLQEVGGQR